MSMQIQIIAKGSIWEGRRKGLRWGPATQYAEQGSQQWWQARTPLQGCALCVWKASSISSFFLPLKLNSFIIVYYVCILEDVDGVWVNSEPGYVIWDSCGSLAFTHSFIRLSKIYLSTYCMPDTVIGIWIQKEEITVPEFSIREDK